MNILETLSKIDKEELQKIINNSTSLSNVIHNIGFRFSTTTFKIIKKYLYENNLIIDKSIWLNNLKIKKSKNISLDRFSENSDAHRGSLKSFIIKYSLKEYKCDWCGLKDTWNNKPIVLILDHINGIPSDNRLKNLRFLCPNCNSQTDTFTGRNQKRKINLNKCSCGKIIGMKSRKCCRCSKLIPVPIEKEALEKLVWELPIVKIASKYSISENTVINWCKNYNIVRPKRGYWLSKKT
jgi:hypothetical protein